MQADITNGAYNASTCANIPTPTWCSGSDIGAWINSAIRAQTNNFDNTLPVKVIIEPRETPYSQTTTIVIPLNTLLDCQTAKLLWQSTAGTAVQVGYGKVTTDTAQMPIQNCQFTSAGDAETNTNTGVFFGGDTFSTTSPAESYGHGKTLENVLVNGFGTGISWGNHAWAMEFIAVNADRNKNNILVPRIAITAFASSYSISGTTLTVTVPNSASVGQNVQISGTGNAAIDDVGLRIVTANSTTITATLPAAASGSGTGSFKVYYNGVHDTGELIRFTNSNITNARNCGMVGTDINSEISFVHTSLDYNRNGEFCGGVNVALLNVHMERGGGPFIDAESSSIRVRMSGGQIATTNGTGADTGFVTSTNASSVAYFSDVQVIAKHPVSYWVYTGATTFPASSICVRTPIYLSVVQRPGYTNSPGQAYCEESAVQAAGVAIGTSPNLYAAPSLAMDDCGGGQNGGCAAYGNNTASLQSLDWNNGGIRTNKVGGRVQAYAFINSGTTANRPLPWVNGYTVTSGGTGGTDNVGYSATFSGGSCTSLPTASYTIAGGAVSAIQIRFGGNCTVPPTISFLAGGVTGAAATLTLSALPVGTFYFDTTLGYPVWLKTSPATWVDASGTVH